MIYGRSWPLKKPESERHKPFERPSGAAMTEAFEKWFIEKDEHEPIAREAAFVHWWLSVFVKEIYGRYMLDGMHHDMKPSFDRLVRDFGLDGKEGSDG